MSAKPCHRHNASIVLVFDVGFSFLSKDCTAHTDYICAKDRNHHPFPNGPPSQVQSSSKWPHEAKCARSGPRLAGYATCPFQTGRCKAGLWSSELSLLTIWTEGHMRAGTWGSRTCDTWETIPELTFPGIPSHLCPSTNSSGELRVSGRTPGVPGQCPRWAAGRRRRRSPGCPRSS